MTSWQPVRARRPATDDADDSASDPGSDPDANPDELARSICLSQLDRAPRTRGQLAAVLQRRNVPDDVAERALDRLAQVGLLDDEAFAHAWVESRHRSRGLSGGALARELRTRGVAEETVSSAVGQLDADAERATARAIAARRQRSMSSLDASTQQRRLVSLLGRKGYSAGVAYAVVREVVSAAQAAEQAESLTRQRL